MVARDKPCSFLPDPYAHLCGVLVELSGVASMVMAKLVSFIRSLQTAGRKRISENWTNVLHINL